ARYTVRTAALEHDQPADVLAILNQALLADASDRPFVTACLMFVDSRHQLSSHATATITVAGHPLPLLRNAAGQVRPVGESGDLLGVLETPSFHTTTIDLQP